MIGILSFVYFCVVVKWWDGIGVFGVTKSRVLVELFRLNLLVIYIIDIFNISSWFLSKSFFKRYMTGAETKVCLVCTLYRTNLVLLQMCHFQVHHTCYWHITIKLNRYADNGNRRRSGFYTDIHTKSCVEFSKKHDVVYLILRLFQFFNLKSSFQNQGHINASKYVLYYETTHTMN